MVEADQREGGSASTSLEFPGRRLRSTGHAIRRPGSCSALWAPDQSGSASSAGRLGLTGGQGFGVPYQKAALGVVRRLRLAPQARWERCSRFGPGRAG